MMFRVAHLGNMCPLRSERGWKNKRQERTRTGNTVKEKKGRGKEKEKENRLQLPEKDSQTRPVK